MKVLIEHSDHIDGFGGFTENYVKVKIDKADSSMINQIVNVELAGLNIHLEMIGKIIH